ncbi:hypothetical protein CWI75_07485 [Kineobactrum sediminis]|uniref:HNH nuclease domain-containing protein n=1 Tax=Kineobactrum sediminis TaxID=1905677 RepID=A0A2N5Y4C2_9GAMM|nr:HNH endonuclease [Kineobactrum sediminis]PLW83241.1 hypothetical protein CWI75_07485 [Kineobactrum sediminis]
MHFEDWLVSIGKSAKTAKSYSGAIFGVMSTWAAKAGLVHQSLQEIKSVEAFDSVRLGIRQLAIFDARNTVGKGMYSAALNTYAEYLADVTQEHIALDINKIFADSTLTETERATLANTRLGQGKFRSRLIEHWNGCAVTGYRDTRFLVASHIKPWSRSNNEERLDPFNGLLLLPNLDKIFDLGYISFEKSGAICISRELEGFETLGVHGQLRARLAKQHHDYLTYHRDVVFKGR